MKRIFLGGMLVLLSLGFYAAPAGPLEDGLVALSSDPSIDLTLLTVEISTPTVQAAAPSSICSNSSRSGERERNVNIPMRSGSL